MTKKKRKRRSDTLATFERRRDYYNELASDEIAKGELGSRELIDKYLKHAHEAAEAAAPYTHARLRLQMQSGAKSRPPRSFARQRPRRALLIG